MSFDLPELPDGWVFTPLESCAVPGSITYGVVQPGSPVERGVPIIRVNNFLDVRLDLSDVMRISPEVEAKYERTRLRGGEVLLTLVGSVGQVAEVPKACAGFNVARAVGVVKAANGIDAKWIAICLRSPLSQHLLRSRANTTVQTTINLKDVRALPIPIPPPAERLQIAEFVSALDDRIALLRETNATLEAIAQALFKSWFVDFDPVRAKSQGLAPAGMDAATAALFPSEFEESALGLIPEGWKVCALDEIAIYLNGLALQKFPPSDDSWLPIIKIAQLRKGDAVGADRAGRNLKPQYIVQNGDVLFSWSGSLEVEVWCGGEAALNQHLFKVTSKEFPKWFYLHWTRHHLSYFRLVAASKATTMGHIQRVHLSEAKALVPSAALLGALDAHFSPLLTRVMQNQLQARSVATLRDTLLPRLISGQLRLPEASATSAAHA
jgi:type I restriction enzyme, S subunit